MASTTGRVDSDERPFSCPRCSKSFKRREHFTRHFRAHTLEKPFECRFCGKHYSRRDLVTRHEKTLHGPDRGTSSAFAARPAPIRTNTDSTEQVQPLPARHRDAHPEPEAMLDPALFDSTLPQSPYGDLASPLSASTTSDELMQNACTAPSAAKRRRLGKSATFSAPVDTRELPPLPRVADESRLPPLPVATISDSVLAALLEHIQAANPNGPETLSTDIVHACLRTYFKAWDVHLPLSHQPSFDCAKQPPEILLAMAALGALYMYDRKTATCLYLSAAAQAHIDSFHPDHRYAELFYAGDLVSPSQAMTGDVNLNRARTRYLLGIFGVYSGNEEIVDNATARLGGHVNAYPALARRLRDRGEPMGTAEDVWLAWADVEGTKRLLYALWIMSDMLTTMYNLSPGFSVNYDGDIELPCPEAEWRASTAAEWHALRQASPSSRPATIKQAISVISGEHSSDFLADETFTISRFGVDVIMHVMAIHVWQAAHGDTAHNEEDPRVCQLALARCRQLVAGETGVVEDLHTVPRFLFNADAISRICYGRSLPSMFSLDRSCVLRGEPHLVTAAIRKYVDQPIQRSDNLTETIANTFRGFLEPAKGKQLELKTKMPIFCSVELVLAAWDTLLIVRKWVHHMEMEKSSGLTPAETELLDHMYAEWTEVGYDLSTGISKPAIVLRTAADYIAETWTLGVVGRMVHAYHQLADAFEAAMN